jgi:hypothetical protein
MRAPEDTQHHPQTGTFPGISIVENRHITEHHVAIRLASQLNSLFVQNKELFRPLSALEEALANSAKVETIRSFSRWRGQLGLV